MDTALMDPVERLRTALADRYEIDREIGRGGMAAVDQARNRQPGRLVAIKIFRPEWAVSVGGDRFLREIRIAAGLQHPNILPLHDSGSADGALYYVMPLVEGETLRQPPTASSSRCYSRKIHGRESTLGQSSFHRPAALRAAGQGAQWVPP
jgi:serine/threonine protein kinase